MSDAVTLGDSELLTALRNIEEQRNALYGESLSLIAEASSRGLWCSLGYRELPSVLVDILRVGVSDAKHRVSHAQDLLDSHSPSGATVDAALPAVAAASAVGEVGPESVQAICHTVERFPSHATGEDRTTAESILLDAARLHPPKTVARLGRDILNRLDQDGNPPSDKELAEPERYLNVLTRRNGRVALRGELDAETGAVLTTLLSPLAKPRPAEDGRPDPREAGERNGDALAEILQLAATSADTPVEAGEPVNLHVTVGYDALRDATGHATLDDATPLPAAQARRIACDSGIIPTVLGSASEVLDIGRKTRVIPAHIRRALIFRDRGCAFPACERPAKQCHGHHIRHWADGGPTALDNLVLLCGHHHRRIHHTEWSVRISRGRPEFIPPKYLDPRQQPRNNILRDWQDRYAAVA